MTRGKRLFTWVLLQLGLVSGAAGGAVYLYRDKRVKPLWGELAVCQKGQSETLQKTQKNLELMQVRTMLVEAEVGLLRGNGGLAFERVARAQLAARAAGLSLDDSFQEVMGLLVSQDPQAQHQLLLLADKVLTIPVSAVPPGLQGQGKSQPGPNATPTRAGEGADKAPVPDPAGSGSGAAARAPVGSGSGAAATTGPPSTQGGAGGGAPGGGVGVPNPPPAKSRAAAAQEEAYRALLDAKTGLLAGESETAALGKVARARVMLDEAGRTDLNDRLDEVLAALRRREDARARSGIDEALKVLR